MTSAMERVRYERHNFNVDARHERQPVVLKEKHYEYKVETDEYGYLVCQRDPRSGMPITTPRSLLDMCIYRIVQEHHLLTKVRACTLPSNCYQLLLTEAIHQREAQTIEWTVSTWPMRKLRVFEYIPMEDYLEDEYLTQPMENNEKMSLVDCFVLALLKLKPESNLQFVDFTGFDKDRKLSRELSRLPVLWMKPSDRTVEELHQAMSTSLDVTKDKVDRYLNRIYVVYSNIDGEFKHGNKIAPVQILLDLKVEVDDVPIGLSLQASTPFRFKCNRLWMRPIPEVALPPYNIGTVLDTSKLTCFEYDDPLLPNDERRFADLIDGLEQMRCLVTLSLPNCIDCHVNQEMAEKLNHVLKKLVYIQRLGLSYCNLKNKLAELLEGCRHHLVYLNLQDARLTEEDVMYLLKSRCVWHLRELNLSCNDLRYLEQYTMAAFRGMSQMICLSLSHCQLNTHQQVLIAMECKKYARLKVLSMQGYTPLSQNDYLELLRICSLIRNLQKVALFPKAYGFPGSNEKEREINRLSTLKICYRYIKLRGREDIELE